MKSRGILYIVWSNYNKDQLAKSIASAEKFGYKYHIHHSESELPGLAKKSEMYDVTPFETTLYLDIDTEIRGNLDFGFEMAERYGMACCIAPASSAYLAEPNEIREWIHKDLPQLNTGVIFFDKKLAYNSLFDWECFCEEFPKSASKNDQPLFSYAVYHRMNPFILTRNWNYRAKIRYEARVLHGELKILHAK